MLKRAIWESGEEYLAKKKRKEEAVDRNFRRGVKRNLGEILSGCYGKAFKTWTENSANSLSYVLRMFF